MTLWGRDSLVQCTKDRKEGGREGEREKWGERERGVVK